jgi:hypothetical protein
MGVLFAFAAEFAEMVWRFLLNRDDADHLHHGRMPKSQRE